MAFTVTYDGNGSDGGSAPVDPTPYAAGATVAPLQDAGSLTLTGAIFAYWNTKADGSGAFYGWPPPANFNFSMPAANVTLYAQWFVSSGLPNAGTTQNYTFAYDRALAAHGIEPGRTAAAMKAADTDFGVMQGWFPNITPAGPSPIPVYVTSLNGGANNTGALRLKPNGTDPNELRSYIVSEVTESFMQGQNLGWGFVGGVNNEESCGEALSLFLTQQFELQNNITTPYTAFTSNGWLNSSLPQSNPNQTRYTYNSDGSINTDFGARLDYVNSTLPYPGNGPGTGCSMLFINYLYHQLGFTINEIIANAPGYTNGKLNSVAPLRGVYGNLTGDKTDPFPPFAKLLAAFYPPYNVSSIPGPNPDNPFPIYTFTGRNAPAALSESPGATSLYAVRSDGQVWSNFFPSVTAPGEWSGWFALGPNVFPKSAPVTALSLVPGATSLYVIGLDGRVWSNFYPSLNKTGGWFGWFPIGPNVFALDSVVTAISAGPNETSLYVIGLDGQVWTNFYPSATTSGQWNGWFALGPNVFSKASSVTVLSLSRGATSLYVVGIDGRVWSNFYPSVTKPGQWSGWFPIGSNLFALDSAVTAVSTEPNETSLYVIGLDGQVWTNFYPSATAPGEWSGWFALGPNVFSKNSAVTALTLSRGATSLYLMGIDGQVWSNFFPSTADPGHWSGWFPIGPNVFPLNSVVTAVSTGSNETSLYVADDAIWTNFYPRIGGPDEWNGWFSLLG
jgi:hypothetical protein